MISSVFADTYYYLALINPGDAGHQRALAASRTSSQIIFTSAWIIQELADALAAPPARMAVMRMLASIQADMNTFIIEPDSILWHSGLKLYRSRADKSWSLTDCVSFQIMRDKGIKDALTADRHFEQAGFVALLKLGT